MTILDNTGESEIVHLLDTIQELSEQIAQNRSISIALHTSAGVVKVSLYLLRQPCRYQTNIHRPKLLTLKRALC